MNLSKINLMLAGLSGRVLGKTGPPLQLAPDMRAQICDVGWGDAGLEAVEAMLRKRTERQLRYRENVAAWWSPALLPGLFLMIPLGHLLAGEGSPVTAVLILLWGAVVAVGLISLELRWVREDAPIRLLHELLRASAAATAAAWEPGRMENRAVLYDRVQIAAREFDSEYGVGSGGRGASHEWKKLCRREARRCSFVLRSYEGVVVGGSRAELEALRDDLLRAAMRVASGNWLEVLGLKPGTEIPPRGWREVIARAVNLREFIAFTTACTTAVIVIIKIATGSD